MTFFAVLGLAFGVLAFVLRWLARLVGRQTGVAPTTRVVASDVEASPGRLLRDTRHRLQGKPDYLLEEHGCLVPLELKPTRHSRTDRPYLSDELQVATYLLCLRAEEPTRAASYGRVRYANREFVITLTPALEAQCLEFAAAIRAARRGTEVRRTHKSPAKCRACGLRHACTDRLSSAGPRAEFTRRFWCCPSSLRRRQNARGSRSGTPPFDAAGSPKIAPYPQYGGRCSACLAAPPGL